MKDPYDLCVCDHPRVEHNGTGCLCFTGVGDLHRPSELCLCSRFQKWPTGDMPSEDH